MLYSYLNIVLIKSKNQDNYFLHWFALFMVCLLLLNFVKTKASHILKDFKSQRNIFHNDAMFKLRATFSQALHVHKNIMKF